MLTEYIEEALRRAHYALIDDPETPYFGEIPDLPGVWASADTLEGCRRELKDTVEGWILLSVKRSLPIPKLGEIEIASMSDKGHSFRVHTKADPMRTNIVIDDALMDKALSLSGLSTKRETVEEALQLLVRLKQQEGIRDAHGKPPWDGDLDALRRDDGQRGEG